MNSCNGKSLNDLPTVVTQRIRVGGGARSHISSFQDSAFPSTTQSYEIMQGFVNGKPHGSNRILGLVQILKYAM